MAITYAQKYRRSPYPQATHIKNFLQYVSLGGGTFWHPPQDKFSFIAGGDDYLYWGIHVLPSPLLRTLTQTTFLQFVTRLMLRAFFLIFLNIFNDF